MNNYVKDVSTKEIADEAVGKVISIGKKRDKVGER